MPESQSELVEFFFQIWQWIGVYYWILLVAAVVFAIIFMSVYKFERRYIRHFKPADEKKLPTPSFYTREMNEKAAKLGFHNCGWYAQDIGKLYRCTATIWISPDNLTLLVVGGGKLAGINYMQTWLYSKPVEGAVLVTSDQIGEVDSTGFLDKEFLFNADLEELWELHKSRLQFLAGKVEKFDRTDVLAEYEELVRIYVNVHVEHGLARWLDKKKEQWRYTLKGAIQSYICNRTEMRKAKKQEKRLLKRKPGEAIGGFGSMGALARVRDLLMSPSEIVKDAGVGLGDVVLDFGCGDWSCSIAAAEVVGAEGKVYALDIHPDACRQVNKRATKKSLRNIVTIRSECMTGLTDECADIVFLHEVLHALGYKKKMVLRELHRVLKVKGILSFSDHNMKTKEIIAAVTEQGLFKLLKEGGDLYRFTKVTV
ncbi:MAG: class I SAM-dependent methyltransferase [Planctomycetota bacterium]|jgi:2-polyprenyl-3-methyl-5-hydroxy-6-metoxy-1,4-benzoquinol methylase